MLQLDGISKTYRQPDADVQVLNNVCLQLPDGSSAALQGESGSGKSTLLNLVAGLDQPDAGKIFLDGEELTSLGDRAWNQIRRDKLSIVFQQYHLVPTLNVHDNILLQARLSGMLDRALESRLIDQLGLKPLLQRLPHQLSGGQQQRVAIARAVMHRPRLILADEPTGNLDEGTSHAVLQLFVELVRSTGSSLLMVTHSTQMAAYLDSQWLLHDGHITSLHDQC